MNEGGGGIFIAVWLYRRSFVSFLLLFNYSTPFTHDTIKLHTEIYKEKRKWKNVPRKGEGRETHGKAGAPNLSFLKSFSWNTGMWQIMYVVNVWNYIKHLQF